MCDTAVPSNKLFFLDRDHLSLTELWSNCNICSFFGTDLYELQVLTLFWGPRAEEWIWGRHIYESELRETIRGIEKWEGFQITVQENLYFMQIWICMGKSPSFCAGSNFTSSPEAHYLEPQIWRYQERSLMTCRHTANTTAHSAVPGEAGRPQDTSSRGDVCIL